MSRDDHFWDCPHSCGCSVWRIFQHLRSLSLPSPSPCHRILFLLHKVCSILWSHLASHGGFPLCLQQHPCREGNEASRTGWQLRCFCTCEGHPTALSLTAFVPSRALFLIVVSALFILENVFKDPALGCNYRFLGAFIFLYSLTWVWINLFSLFLGDGHSLCPGGFWVPSCAAWGGEGRTKLILFLVSQVSDLLDDSWHPHNESRQHSASNIFQILTFKF